MTTAMLRAAGAGVDDSEPGVWRVHPSLLHPGDVVIEPDLSNAAPFLAAALVTGGRVVVRDWPAVTTQAGAALRDLLTQMGAEVSHGPDGLTVTGTGAVHGLDADLHDVGELTPVLAALAALAGLAVLAARDRAPARARDRPPRRAGRGAEPARW